MIGEEILLEIDETLDQLIRNAEVLKGVDLKDLSETEIDAFQKTQESLLQHLLHMDEFLAAKRTNLKLHKIQEKRIRFEKLRGSYHQTLAKAKPKLPILSKRRSKRFLYRT